MKKRLKIKIFCAAVLGILCPALGGNTLFAESSITISASTYDINMSLMPGSFDSASQTVTVSTDNEAGYTVSLQAGGSTTDLINQVDNTKVIPTVVPESGSSTVPAALVTNGYGYSLDNGANFYPVPAINTSNTIFNTTSASTDTYDLTFGVGVPISTTSGTYTGDVVIRAVVNLIPCPSGSICYFGNGDDGTGEMDNQLAASNAEVVLVPPNFSRPGYGFVGWNTAIDGSGETYGPGQTITTGDLSTQGLQLYAKWVQSQGTFQNWNGCNSLNQNDVIALTDTRDGSTYAVGKFVDDQCWMVENLRLDFSDPDLVINDSNTNNPKTSFASSINENHPSPTNSFCIDKNSACIDQILYNTNNTDRTLDASYTANNDSSSWYSYGHYYNWYTITAGYGTYNFSTAGAAVDGDICPAGWRLPSGYGDAGDLSKLDVLLGGNGKNETSGSAGGYEGTKRWRSFPLNFFYGGEQNGDSSYNRGNSSSYATMNSSSTDRTTNLWIKSDGVYMNSNNTLKTRGQTVRCVAKKPSAVTGNIHYNANGGTGTMADEINVQFNTAVAAENGFTKDYSRFVSWNTSPNGSGVTVVPGGSVSNAASHMEVVEGGTLTLYAIWRSEYSLVYDGNGAVEGSMTVANISSLQTGNLSLVPSNFSRAGYGFAGWSFDSDAATKLASGTSVDIYGPNQSVNVNSAFLAHADPTNNRVTLYAVWIPQDTTYNMQTFGATQCANKNPGDVFALKDIRDNNVYTIAKLADGNCWMVENLRLTPSVTPLDDNNTNKPTALFAQEATTATSSNTLCKSDSSACDVIGFNSNLLDRDNNPSYSSNTVNVSWYGYGIMYNWYTATAGNGTFAMDSGNVAGDICPAGWRLPTGGPGGEFAVLNGSVGTSVANSTNATNDANAATGLNAVDELNGENNLNAANDLGATNAANVDVQLLHFPNNFIYSGDYNNKTPGGRSTYGRFWSATPNGTKNAYRLGVAPSGATPDGSWNKWVGFAVRCIVK